MSRLGLGFADEQNPPQRFINRSTETRFTIPGWFIGFTALNFTPSLNVAYYTPILITETRTFDRIGIDVTTAGAASDVARLAIYSSKLNAAGLAPDGLILDAGNILIDSTGEKLITISEQLSPGYYFLAFTAESGLYAAIEDLAAATPPVTGYASDDAGGNLDDMVPLQTISSDWPTNGYPTVAPAMNSAGRSTAAPIRLRDST